MLAANARKALRRAVHLECETRSALWDETAPLLATDLSTEGIWLNSDLPLDVGEQLVLSFRPPRWPEWGWPVTVLAEVVRVALPRRREDRGLAGMGLRFLDLDPEQGARMASSLRGLPPPLPPALPRAVRPRARVSEAPLEEHWLLVDGIEIEFVAEAALLSIGRRAERLAGKPPALRRARARKAHSKQLARKRAKQRRLPVVVARRAHLRLVG